MAGLVMKRGGYGLKRDIILGVVGSIGGSALLRTLGVFKGHGAGRLGLRPRRLRGEAHGEGRAEE